MQDDVEWNRHAELDSASLFFYIYDIDPEINSVWQSIDTDFFITYNYFYEN